MDEEILELGDDGAFEIKSTKAVKQATVVHPDYTATAFADQSDDEDNTSQEILDNLEPSEFRVYKSSGYIYAIVRLEEGSSVAAVGLAGQDLSIKTNEEKEYHIPLSNCGLVDQKSGKCTIWKDYVTVKYALSSE